MMHHSKRTLTLTTRRRNEAPPPSCRRSGQRKEREPALSPAEIYMVRELESTASGVRKARWMQFGCWTRAWEEKLKRKWIWIAAFLFNYFFSVGWGEQSWLVGSTRLFVVREKKTRPGAGDPMEAEANTNNRFGELQEGERKLNILS
jgi:hypothetical protein